MLGKVAYKFAAHYYGPFNNQKLAVHYYGPFNIIENMLGEVAYKLQLLENSKVHLVFHNSQNKAIGNYQVQGELLRELEVQITEETSLEKVVGK